MTIDSIGDDVQFWAELSHVRLSKTPQEQIKRAEDFLVPYLDSKLQALRLAGSTSIGDDARDDSAFLAHWDSTAHEYGADAFGVAYKAARTAWFAAPAAQASATIQAAPDLSTLDRYDPGFTAEPVADGFYFFAKDVEELLAAAIQEPVMVAEPVGDLWRLAEGDGHEIRFNAPLATDTRKWIAYRAAPMVAEPVYQIGSPCGRYWKTTTKDAYDSTEPNWRRVRPDAAPMVADPAGVMEESGLNRLERLARAATQGQWEYGSTPVANSDEAVIICKENIEATKAPIDQFYEVWTGGAVEASKRTHSTRRFEADPMRNETLLAPGTTEVHDE